MRYKNLFNISVISLLFLVLFIFCNRDEASVDPNITVQSIKLSTSETYLKIGKTHTLTAIARDANGEEVKKAQITWESSRPNVASVDDGVVTALTEGTTTIIASVGEAVYEGCDIFAYKVNSVTLPIDYYSLLLWEEFTLQPIALDGTGREIQDVEWNWISTNELVASVENGLITPVSGGMTEILVEGDGVPSEPCEIQIIEEEIFPVWTGEHDWHVKEVVFNPDGSQVASASRDNTFKVWDSNTGSLIWTGTHDNHVEAVAFSSDGNKLVSGGFDKKVKVWNAIDGSLIWTRTVGGYLEAVAFTPDNKIVISVGGHLVGYIDAWSNTGDYLWGRTEGGFDLRNHITCLALHPDGNQLVYGAQNNKVRVCATNNGGLIWHGEHDDEVLSVCFNPDSTLTASVGGNDVKIWRSNGATLWAGTHSDVASSVKFKPDGTTVASVGYDKRLKLWDVATGTLIWEKKHNSPLLQVDFSPDGNLIVVGGQDNRITIRNSNDGSIVGVGVHGGYILSLDFSHQDDKIVTGSKTKSVKVWHVYP